MDVGFENSPLTKYLCGSVFILTIVFGNVNQKESDLVSLDLHGLYRGELWRLFVSPFCFRSMPQLVVGIMLMYTLRQFERQLGPRKFGSLVFLGLILSVLLHFAAIAIAFSCGYHIVPSPGPFFFIYALLPLFYKYIPRLHPLRVGLLGVFFSEKSWTYLLATQLAMSEGAASLTPSLAALLVGYLYCFDNNSLGLQAFRVPSYVERPFVATHTFISGFVQLPGLTTATNRRPRAAGANNPGRMGMGPALGQNMFPPQGANMGASPPSEESVSALINLGFERGAATRALSMCGNNLEMAANLLLSGG